MCNIVGYFHIVKYPTILHTKPSNKIYVTIHFAILNFIINLLLYVLIGSPIAKSKRRRRRRGPRSRRSAKTKKKKQKTNNQ